ncbi:hypothetical protein [Lactiplantibacillus plantarum]|uniref:hypothetical protein n=1 Tax=Lactiplantibacillus plantarum TaxID=1590 RepID=UPI0015F01FCC|nr:hypothetical protein [Lactiplantibacillus plantarum]MCG0715585.1 hypothetical protein [Lactiplantibacillus plantarum]
MEQFTKDLTKTLLSNGDVKELFRQQLETAINQWSPVNKIDNLNRDFFVLCHD